MLNDLKQSENSGQRPGILTELPRRPFIEASTGDVSLSQMRLVAFKTNRIRALASLFGWLQLLLDFFLHVFVSVVMGKDNPKQRAVHLRNAFEHRGGSFVKLGIHLSMRLDFMPWVYCNELSCMTDRMTPFPIGQAVEAVEHSTGKHLSATFSRFDPVPIISTSVACSYQAILLNGEKVVVKVRRPGIGEQFMSDIAAFDWLLSITEFLTIFRPGLTSRMRTEFRNLLLEEMDFIQEARRQDAFRRATAVSRKSFFSAPRILLDFSTEAVIINEFVSGIWLWELLDAVKQNNQTILSRVQEMNIDPKLVAKRLLWVNYWSWSEHLFFHADPNPDNVIIGRNGVLYFINFTSSGTLSQSKRQALRQNLDYAWERDPQNMARTMIILLEPLPPLDMIELVQELETYNWQLIYALEAAPHSVSWQERTSATQWAGVVQIARKYGIVIDIQILRLIRSTLLLESMAARLHGELDFVDQYRRFKNYRAEEARRRVTDSILNQMDGVGTEQTIIKLDRMAQAARGLLFRTAHMLSLPSVNFNTLMSKWSYSIYTLLRFLAQAAAITLIFFAFTSFPLFFLDRQPINVLNVLQKIATNPLYELILLVLIFINGRTVLFRLDDKEIQ
jgi:ubiquinone biosynthesis protein